MRRQIKGACIDPLKIDEWRDLYREMRTRAPEFPGMITVAKACMKYCLTGATLQAWRAAGLRYKRIGHWIFMPEQEIKRLAAEYWKSN